jgi:hypothetical protein
VVLENPSPDNVLLLGSTALAMDDRPEDVVFGYSSAPDVLLDLAEAVIDGVPDDVLIPLDSIEPGL